MYVAFVSSCSGVHEVQHIGFVLITIISAIVGASVILP